MARQGEITVTQKLIKVVVTDRPKAPPNKKKLDTPAGDDDVQVIVMGWARQAGIRTLRTFLQSLLGLLGVTGIADVSNAATVIPGSFWNQVLTAAIASLAVAFVTFCWNAFELLSKLDPPQTRA